MFGSRGSGQLFLKVVLVRILMIISIALQCKVYFVCVAGNAKKKLYCLATCEIQEFNKT